MARDSESQRILKKKSRDIEQFEKEAGNILHDIHAKDDMELKSMSRDEESKEIQNDIEEYDKKLEELKKEIKRLKKIKRQQKKISKLQEKRMDVLKEIEKRRESEKRLRRHKHH